jgi:membrane-associated phospholipid phosphatase
MLLAGSAVEPETASAFEVGVFRVFNDAPNVLYPVVWPLMQYGTFITIPIATLVALLFYKFRLGVEMASAGVAVYGLAKLAKDAFPRGRQGAVLVDAELRGVPAGQEGFPSGHAAVSAVLAFILFAYLPGRWRWAPFALAVVVSGRLYVGAHFPLDVVGGASLGIAAGALATLIGAAPERHRSRGKSDSADDLGTA